MKNLELLRRLFLALWFIATVVPSVDTESCNSLCIHPHTCQTDSGKCKCVVGWTGPDAFYIDGNHVLADYCNDPCHYTSVVKNSTCAADAHPTTTTTTTVSPTTTSNTTKTSATPPETTATTTTPLTTTTTTTTRSPANILAKLCEQIGMAQSLLNKLKEIISTDPSTMPDKF